MISLFKRPFILLSILFLLFSAPLFLYDKDVLNILIANHSSKHLSYFFFTFTKMGEGIFIAIISILLLFRHVGKATYLILSVVCSSIICQIIKHSMNIPRPKLFMENFEIISKYCFWEIHSWLSFPSGHTTAAFALFCSISFIFNNRSLAIICFLSALGVGLSRVYLLQHFFIDIYIGTIIGTGISTLFFKLIYPNFVGKRWAEFSLLTWIRSRA